MTSLLAWIFDAVLLLPGKSRVEEDDSISEDCVERCVDDEIAPVVAVGGHRTRDKFYSFPRKRKAIFQVTVGTTGPETRGPRSQYREYWNQHIEDG